MHKLPIPTIEPVASGLRIRYLRFLIFLASVMGAVFSLPACQSPNAELVKSRKAAIMAEPRGDYFVGRRYFAQSRRFWGYLRHPGQDWETAELVVMSESRVKQPDRLPEVASVGPVH